MIDKIAHKKVGKMLDDFNSKHVKKKKGNTFNPLQIILRDDRDEIVGGLYGSSSWGCMEIKVLAVLESKRKQGHGTLLLQEAEGVAKRRGCRYITLSSFSFQAPSFYEKMGFRNIGTEKDFPAGYEKYYYRKELK